MQQLIQERNVSFSLLGRAEVLCNTWDRVQSKSLSILQNINNIISQQLATIDLPTTSSDHGVQQSRLIFKQTESLENSIKSTHDVLVLFEKVKNDWQKLEAESVTAVSPIQVNDMISRLACMYKEELDYKTALITTLPIHLSTQDQILNLTDRWALETGIDEQVREELSERIKLYKTVKRVLESVD
ncbi:unnamed protein product [Mucor hiemalis]